MQPKVSVIVPCYGVEKYLDRCMESLVNQTLRDIEIILVDDVSPDRVPEMCDEWAAKSLRGEKVNGLTIPPIKVIHKEKNGGLGFARNTGLEVATGEYVAFVDSDDYIDTTAYEKYYLAAKEHDADAVFSCIRMEKTPGNWMETHEVRELTTFDGKEKVQGFMLNMIANAPHVGEERFCHMSVWHAIYKRSIIQDNNITFHSEREIVSEDIPFQVDFLKCACKVVYLPDAFYYYCLNGGSLTGTFKPEKFERHIKLHALLSEQTSDVIGAQARVDRFLIGYNRSHILQCVGYGYPHKLQHLRDIVNNGIWSSLRERFNPSWLSSYARIFYVLTISKHVHMLYGYCWFITKLKNIMGVRQ